MLASTAALLSLTGGVAEGTELCKKKNGVVVARDTCKAKETVVTLPPAGSQVVDSAGRVVGALLPGLDEDCNLLRPLGDGTAVGLVASAEGVQGCGSSLQYETPDCTGTPYLTTVLGFVRTSSAQPDPTTGQLVIYYASGPIQRRAIQSTSDDLTGSGCVTFVSVPVAVGHAMQLDLSSLTPPLRIP